MRLPAGAYLDDLDGSSDQEMIGIEVGSSEGCWGYGP